MKWQNRIIGSGEENPINILSNPFNYRIHPKFQQDVLQGLLKEIGWIQDVIINKQTGHLIDGHLRVTLAMKNKETQVPVKYVDLTQEEEMLALSVFDPISALAETDEKLLTDLLDKVQSEDEDINKLLKELSHNQEEISDDTPDSSSEEGIHYKQQFGVIVMCDSEEQQERVYNELMEQGYTCKVVTV